MRNKNNVNPVAAIVAVSAAIVISILITYALDKPVKLSVERSKVQPEVVREDSLIADETWVHYTTDGVKIISYNLEIIEMLHFDSTVTMLSSDGRKWVFFSTKIPSFFQEL